MSCTERRGGFVLMEAVVALAIISIFAVALLTATGTQVRAADQANVLLVARALADDRMTSLELLGYDDLASLPDSLEAGTFAAPFQEYSWTASAEVVKDEQDLFALEVIVAGRGQSFPLHSLTHRLRAVQQARSL